MTQPIHDFTGRGERGGRAVGGGALGEIDPYNNEWVRMRQQQNTEALYEALGMVFPIHPALGHQLQELGNMIVDVASGGGTTVAQDRAIFKGEHDPSSMDRVGGLLGTWTGNTFEDIGQALGMTPEDLARVARAFKQLQSDPEAQGELLRGLGQSMKARYGGEDGPLAAAEDFGSPGLSIAASGKAAGLMRKLVDKETGKPVSPGLQEDPGAPATPVHKGMVNTPHHPPAAGLMGMIRKDAPQGPLATPSDAKVILDQAAELGTGPSTRQGMPLADWDPPADSAEYKEFLDRNEIENPPVSREEGLRDPDDVPEYQAFEMKQKEESTPSKPSDPKFVPLADNEIVALSDDALDIEINRTNTTINSMTGSDYVDEEYEDTLRDFKDELDKLVAERHRRRRESGGGSAGAKKQMSQLDQMKAEGAGEPDAGWPVAHGIEGFTGDADFGAEVTDLLSKAQFSTKRNLWIFPDVGAGAEGTFDINGFINRMGNPRHPVNTEELSILGDVLTLASQYPSKRNLSSMAEDLYKMVSGTIKERLRADQGKLFDPGTLGFDL